MNHKNTHISDPNVDKILKQTTWMTYKELSHLENQENQDAQKKKLRKYIDNFLVQRFWIDLKDALEIVKDNKIFKVLLDEVLIALLWHTLEELKVMVTEKKYEKKLNKYRDWLALWEEFTRDTKNKVIVTLDGRDTAWKWSNILKVSQDLPKDRYSIKAFGKPKFIDKFEYNHFLKYVKYFPWEEWWITFFDRSWYNRAWVEAVMWFCTDEEYNWFMENVSEFEKTQIIEQWINYVKIYLSIAKNTQEERLKLRKARIRKRYKISPIDQQAQKKWNYYTLAKAKILELTDSEHAPWTVVDSNEKWDSAVEIIKAIINTSGEVADVITKELWLNLVPNDSVVRSANLELERMGNAWDLEKMKEYFKFNELNEQEQKELQELKDSLIFDKENYIYIKK